MYRLYDLLEKRGLGFPKDMPKIASMSAKELRQIHQDLFDFVFEAQNDRVWGKSLPAHDTFSFLASASLRGASGCGSIDCMGRKLQFIGRYAALYANELSFPLRIKHPKPHQELEAIRDWLVHDLFALLLLRPLVTGGVVVPVVMRTEHCVHEIEFVERSKEIVHDFSHFAAKQMLQEFALAYQKPDKSPSGKPTLYLSGPEDYIEHGGLAQILDEEPDWLPRKRKYNKDGMMPVERTPYKQYMVNEIFADMGDNITFFLAYGLKRKAKFLSDMVGETIFLEFFNHDDRLDAKTFALKQLEHSVPVLLDLPLDTILRVRNEEKEVFDSYRDAVTKMSAEILGANTKVTKAQARQMMRDAIEPKLMEMKKELKTYRTVRRRRTLGGIASIAAGVLLGAFAGMPTLAATAVVGTAALVGGEMLAKTAKDVCTHGPQFKQKNDLYFLLRLQQEA
jgi:hypothetical protein